jgi:hypothetical protein
MYNIVCMAWLPLKTYDATTGLLPENQAGKTDLKKQDWGLGRRL